MSVIPPVPRMPRIPPDNNILLPIEETGETSAMMSSMTTLFHVMAHRPAIMQQSAHLLETTMRMGTVDPKLKELVAVRVSQVNHCFY